MTLEWLLWGALLACPVMMIWMRWGHRPSEGTVEGDGTSRAREEPPSSSRDDAAEVARLKARLSRLETRGDEHEQVERDP
jgi:hypothetical protein